MKAATLVLGLLAMAPVTHASEAELQITPRLGFGEIELDPGVLALNSVNEEGVDTVDAGVAFAYATPFWLVLEAGLQFQSNFSLFGAFDQLDFLERYVAAGLQLELGNGVRLSPKVGRTRWHLRNEEGRLFNPGPEAREELEGYEDFWEVSLTKSISDYVDMGVRYKSAEHDFGRVSSVMFVTTFGIR